MSKPLLPLNRATLAEWQARLGRITATSQRRFGSLPPADMLRHLRRSLEPVTGDFDPGVNMSNVLTRTAIFHWVFLAMPWPKGKVKAPDWMTPPAQSDVDAERRLLFATMEKYVAMLDANPAATTPNPLLGPVTLEYISRLQGKHLEHHCEQFGV